MTKTLSDWDIELDFPNDLFSKIKSVKKVRLRLKLELLSLIGFIIFSFINAIFFSIWFIVFVILSVIFIIQNIRVWVDIYKIKAERFKKHNSKT